MLTGCLAPTIAKAFGAPSIAVNGTTTLTFTLTNPNTVTALTGVGFTDTLPAGLVVATPNGLANTCGGTVTAIAGSGSVVLTSGGLAADGSCTITVNVTGTTAGTKNNTTSAVTSAEGGTGGTASASLTVAAVVPPTIAKAFGAREHRPECDDDVDVHADQPEHRDRTDRCGLHRHAAGRSRRRQPERSVEHVQRRDHRNRGIGQHQLGEGDARRSRVMQLHA